MVREEILVRIDDEDVSYLQGIGFYHSVGEVLLFIKNDSIFEKSFEGNFQKAIQAGANKNRRLVHKYQVVPNGKLTEALYV